MFGNESTPFSMANFKLPTTPLMMSVPSANTMLYPKTTQRIVTKPAMPKHWAMTERMFLRRTRPP